MTASLKQGYPGHDVIPKIIFRKIQHVFNGRTGSVKVSIYEYENEKRYFKKYIKNNKVIVNEITTSEFQSLNYNKFINESEENFILNIFDGNQNKNYIFFDSNDDMFPINLLNLFSLMVVHGKEHNFLTFSEKLETIKNKVLISTCGPSSQFFNSLLKKYNIKSRVVTTLTLDNWNSYDNGHTLLEVFSKKMNKWFLYDLDNQKVFMNNGEFLDLVEIQSFDIDDIEFISTSDQPNLDWGSFNKYSSYSEYINLNPENWYRRVFQKFGILDEENQKYIFLTNYNNSKNDEDDCQIIKKYNINYECLDYNSFINKFYNN